MPAETRAADDDTIIGIDLGTTNSEVAIISGGKPSIVEEERRSHPALVRGDSTTPAPSSSAAGPATRPRPLRSGRCSRSSA